MKLGQIVQPALGFFPAEISKATIQPLTIYLEDICHFFFVPAGEIHPRQNVLPLAHFRQACKYVVFLPTHRGLILALGLRPEIHQERCQVTVTHVLGIFAMAACGSLLLSEPLLGRDLLTEVTGMRVTSLYLLCAVSITVGAVAVRVRLQEEREFDYPQGGNHE